MSRAFDSAPFDFTVSKDGRILIRWSGRLVTLLKGEEAERFLKRAAGLEREALQLLLARVTGNFKRGNEKAGRSKR